MQSHRYRAGQVQTRLIASVLATMNREKSETISYQPFPARLEKERDQKPSAYWIIAHTAFTDFFWPAGGPS